ncbi:MAG: FG-GAP repeat protein, partial [Planctomycetes bacterium]|nr:FG-GAP repeat protein [Planctomycetota bacterium]
MKRRILLGMALAAMALTLVQPAPRQSALPPLAQSTPLPIPDLATPQGISTYPWDSDDPIPRRNDWWTQAMKRIQREEYRPSWQPSDGAGHPFPDGPRAHFTNRCNAFRVYLDSAGPEFIPRETDPGHPWSLRLQTAELRRGETTLLPGRVEPQIQNDQVVYPRPWGTEWYENSTAGLEQLFMIWNRLPGESPLEIRLHVHGLRVSKAFEEYVVFAAESGDVLKYGKLLVRDGAGKSVPGRILCDGEALTLAIDDQRAQYPLFVDPLASTPAWTVESNQADANFGWNASTAGDVNADGYSDVIVGAYYYDNGQSNEGMAFVYHGSASGLSATANWTAESDQANAIMGMGSGGAGDVNGDGYDDVIVGARGYTQTQSEEGKVYVFHGSASGLSTTANWTALSGWNGGRMGHSVNTAGDVNGDGYSDVIAGGDWPHTAWVWHGSSSGIVAGPAAWTKTVSGQFGFRVNTAGDVNGDGYDEIIVGAHQFSNGGGQNNEGAAFVYHGTAAGVQTNASWQIEPNLSNRYLGQAVGTAGDVNGDGYGDVIVGAPGDPGGADIGGWVDVFHGSSSGLSATANWTANVNQDGASCGRGAATAGDVNGDGYSDVIYAANAYDNGQADEGIVRVHYGSSTGLSATPNWSYEGNVAGGQFGRNAVNTAGDVNADGFDDVIIGAHNWSNPESVEGKVWVFLGAPGGLSTSASWSPDGGSTTANFGKSVAGAGDVNGDGYADVVVGAPGFDNGQADEGAVFVFHGSTTGVSAVPNWTAEGNLATANFGILGISAGDVNRDGFSDLYVGASGWDNVESNEGRGFVYHGSASGLPSPATASWSVESNWADAYYGDAAGWGDVNGDGYADLIVGATGYGNGRAFAYHGSASGLSTTANWWWEGTVASEYFGVSVGSGGDVNRDGYSDVIVGSLLYANPESGEGAARVFHGSSSGLSAAPNWTKEGDQVDAWFGRSVAMAGDVNGDGYSDVIVGAPQYTNGQAQEGQAFVYHGGAGGLSATANWTAQRDKIGAQLGTSVATAGDVNGDGYSDVIIGAPYFTNGETNEGIAMVYHGSSSGLSASVGWLAESNQLDTPQFGASVACAGDVNGDGYSDVLVGAYNYDNPEVDEGRAFLYYGNGGAGIPLRPRQARADDTGLVQLLNTPESLTSARIRFFARSIMGRSKVKLQWEVKPLGTNFNLTSLGLSSSWTDVGLSGTEINELISGLSTGTSYHWRVRLKYFPYMMYSRWLSFGPNGWNEADFRIPAPSGPTVTNVTSTAANGTYGVGATIPVTVTFSSVVYVTGTPQLTLATGGPGTAVNYSSGSGTNTLTFTYTVATGDSSPDLDYSTSGSLTLNGGTIQDAGSNNAVLTLPIPGAANSLGANKAIVIEGIVPTVTNVTSTTADGTYGIGATLSITVTFSEAVTVTGTPQLTLATGGPGTIVNYSSGSGTNTLTFTYTVAAGNTSLDLDYVATNSLTLNGGSIQDATGNNATLTLPSPGGAGSLSANKDFAIDGGSPVYTQSAYRWFNNVDSAGFGGGGVVTGAAASYEAYDIAADSTYMYVAGSNAADWRIEKRLL